MKRIFSVVIAAIIVASASACGAEDTSATSNEIVIPSDIETDNSETEATANTEASEDEATADAETQESEPTETSSETDIIHVATGSFTDDYGQMMGIEVEFTDYYLYDSMNDKNQTNLEKAWAALDAPVSLPEDTTWNLVNADGYVYQDTGDIGISAFGYYILGKVTVTPDDENYEGFSEFFLDIEFDVGIGTPDDKVPWAVGRLYYDNGGYNDRLGSVYEHINVNRGDDSYTVWFIFYVQENYGVEKAVYGNERFLAVVQNSYLSVMRSAAKPGEGMLLVPIGTYNIDEDFIAR